MLTGELAKMKLVSYADKACKIPNGNYYEVLINPETYTLTYGNESSDTTPPGGGEASSNQNRRIPQKLSFKFLFDGTGVIRSGSGPGGLNITPTILGVTNKRDVAQDLQDFKDVVYKYSSSTHQPGFVQIQWGKLMWNCQLITMTIAFKLFNPDGSPLRAEADCSFKEVIDDVTLAASENKMSPDLTHVHTVAKGDTLSLLCNKEYGDSSYYYQIGKFNRLADFKNLTPGTKLIFPPINRSN